MRCKILLSVIVTFFALSTIVGFHLVPSVCASPYVAFYYPSGYSLLGSTALVSGAISELQRDDGVYMTFRSYVSAHSTANTKAFIAYRDSTTSLNTPKERTWNGSNWGSQSEMPTSSSPVRIVRTAYNPIEQKNFEKVAVTLSDDGYIDAYIYDGSSWSVTNNIGQVWSTAPSGPNRPYDVAYESLSGDILLVYGTTVGGGTNDLAYRTWSLTNGWSSEYYWNDADHAGKISVTFIALASVPNADKIGMVYIDSSNSDANAVVWGGSSWGNFVEVTSNVAITTEESVAIASETTSGALVVVAGEAQFIKWTRFTASWSSLKSFDINSGASGAMNWLKIAQAQDDRLFLTSVDASSDLSTAILDEQSIGNRQWETATESIGSMTSTTSISSMRFTAQASKSVSNILVYVYTALASPSYRFGIETSQVGYLPNGTYVGGPANYAVATPSGSGWLNLSLPSSALLTSGTVYHITARYNTGTIGTSNYIALMRLGPNMNNFRPRENMIDPWLNTIFGTTIQDRDPIFVLRFGDGSYEAMPYDSVSSPSVYGSNWFSEKWTQYENQTITGLNIPLVKTGTPPDNLYIILRNETDLQNVATLTVPQADISLTLQWYERHFTSPINLVGGKTYRLILESPSSTASNYFSCRSDSTGQSGELTYDGTRSFYSSSTDGGASWTDSGTRDLTYIMLLFKAGTMGWVIHPPSDAAVDTNAQRCADFAWEYSTSPNSRNQGILVYGTTSGVITWRRFRAPNYMTTATSPTMSGGIHPWVQLNSNPQSVGGDIKILGIVITDTIFDIGAVKWDGTTFTVIGTNTISSDVTTVTYESFDFSFQFSGEATEFTSEAEFSSSSNTEFWTQISWIINSGWNRPSITVTMQLYDYVHSNYPTSGDGYISYTSSATPNTDETSNQTITANPMNFRDSSGNWRLKVKGIKSNNIPFDFKADLITLKVTYKDTESPTWSNAGTNNTRQGRPTLFYTKWTDDYGLNGFIFSTNNTGNWRNDTWTSMSGKTSWSNTTKFLNNTAKTVQWRIWANDTSNNWNSTLTFSIKVLKFPVPLFTHSPLSPYTSQTTTFDASASYDPDGTIENYFWTFGDGTNATGMVTNHAYNENGLYIATLKITDNDTLTNTKAETITVLNRLPFASFTESAESVPTGTTIYFNASSSYDLDGYIASYVWNFGDGANGVGITTAHAYSDNGTYTVTLTVTDNDGALTIAQATKAITNRPPTAYFTEDASTVYTGVLIHFNASSSYDPDGFIVNYLWNFGDGSNGAGAIVSHAYIEDGIYTVTLTVEDDDGSTAAALATKTILNRAPTASFTESATTVLTKEIISFDASSSFDADGTIVSYMWNFGDGNTTTVYTPMIKHWYLENGVYTVTLTVEDNDAATASMISVKTVLNRPAVAVFTQSATTVLTHEAVYFNASLSYDPDGAIMMYSWTFGDGASGTGVLASHFYVDNGTYVASLTITDNDGAFSSAASSIAVLNRQPNAIFTESAETAYTFQAISFNASSSYDSDGTIVRYFWDFGDETNATGVKVNHSYLENGIFTVELTVTDNDGAKAVATSVKVILNRPPYAAFSKSAERVRVGDTVTFNASGRSYDLDGWIISYFWNFGDGANATEADVQHIYNSEGNYIVTLTVTDNDYATNTATSSLSVGLWRDIAIVGVTPFKAQVYEGQLVDIAVTVNNDGFATENFNVSVYYSFNNIKVGTRSLTLAPTTQTILVFSWNTTGTRASARIPYSLKAQASLVPNEVDVQNNVYINGTIKVKMPGDVNGDGIIDIYDLINVATGFGSRPGDLPWNAESDINNDNIIDIFDIITVATNYGHEEEIIEVISHTVTWQTRTFYVTTETNSTATNITFNQLSKEISFYVNAPERGYAGYALVTIPNALLGGPYTVRIDGVSVVPTYWGNATHTSLRFRYSFPTPNRRVQIIGTTVIQSSQLRTAIDMTDSAKENLVNQLFGRMLALIGLCIFMVGRASVSLVSAHTKGFKRILESARA